MDKKRALLLLNDMDKILNGLHDQVFGKVGDIKQAEKFQDLGLNIDSICIAQDDLYQLGELIKKVK